MNSVFKLLVLFSLFIICSQTHADIIERFINYKMDSKISKSVQNSVRLGYFEQWIDANNHSLGRFKQRYYVDDSYSKNDLAPVFYYICGETTCTKNALSGAIRDYAKTFNAKLVALEHRYYGESLPFPSLSISHLKYLSTDAALNDLANFQRHMQNQKGWHGRWVAFGGSYPGSLSAYYRMKFPYLVVGALASSAPVRAKEDFYEYDAHVTKVAGPGCASEIRKVVSAIESSLEEPAKLNKIKTLFAASKVEDSVDFLYLVADVASHAVQYGERDKFCNALSNDENPINAYANFATNLFSSLGVAAEDLTIQGAMSIDPYDKRNWYGMRQWYYQSCKEYGYWQNAHANPEFSTRSSLINLDYHHTICQRLFELNEPVKTEKINEALYYPLLEVLTSNIFFTNGENDPWSTLSLSEKNGNATNPRLYYQLIEGAAHCEDLHSPSVLDSKSLKSARITTRKLLKEWLQ